VTLGEVVTWIKWILIIALVATAIGGVITAAVSLQSGFESGVESMEADWDDYPVIYAPDGLTMAYLSVRGIFGTVAAPLAPFVTGFSAVILALATWGIASWIIKATS